MSLKIGVLTSTTRPTRFGPKVASWFMDQVKDTSGVEFELIDLAEQDLRLLDEPKSPSSGEYQYEYTKRWSEKIKGLDGFVFVTAEYNNGPPAALKNAIDVIYHEWDRKPVAFVGYGTYGATRAVEQLVDITAKVGMAPLTKTFVGIVKSWEAADEDGNMKPDHVFGNVDHLVENLKWWGETLKQARQSGE
jgi:NAD(P)H-dependent FMN reductase